MKKLLAIATLITGTLVMVSCGDDDGGTTTFDQPNVVVGSAADVANGATDATATFTVTLDEDLTSAATWVLASTGVEAATIGGATSGTIDASGTVTVDITAGTTAGPATLTLTVTNPAEAQGLTGTATAVFSVLDPADNPITLTSSVLFDGDPGEAIIVNDGDGLSVPGTAEATSGDFETDFQIGAPDGLATLTVSVNGGAGVDLIVTGVTNTAETQIAVGDLAVDGIVIPGSVLSPAYTAGQENTLLFTATDANGSSATTSITLGVTEATDSYAATTGVTDLQGNDAVEVVGEITTDVTWDAANVYIITGRLIVGDGGSLTVPAGTIIKAETGSGVNAKALIVAAGGEIFINGSAAAPVIMTSINDGISPGEIEGTLAADVNGLWGGLIVLGNAGISASAAQVQIEGIPTSVTQGLYGGDDDDEDSGDITYLSLRHGGSNIGAGNEINGITLGGVGSGTVINHVEVVANQDDGIEFFGGNVSVTNAVVWNCGDDSMDSDQDWQGTVDNFLIITPAGGSPFEMDGPEGADARTTGENVGYHTFTNGDIFFGGEVTDHVVDWDGSTNAELTNLFFFGFPASTSYPGDDSADPIESFDGDGAGTSADWEAVLNGHSSVDDIFFEVDDNDAEAPINTEGNTVVTAVTLGARTVGATTDDSRFDWTLYSTSGQLADDYEL